MDDVNESREEKSPVERVKSSVSKSKAHSKEKNSATISPIIPPTPVKIEESIESVDSKPSKSKKSIVTVPANPIVDTEIATTASGSNSVTSAGNSTTPVSKHKTKIIKKQKKSTAQQHPAFYFVSTESIK